MKIAWLSLAVLLLGVPLLAPPRQEGLQKALGDTGLRGPWHYEDFEGARKEAARDGKPLLVVLRCVP